MRRIIIGLVLTGGVVVALGGPSASADGPVERVSVGSLGEQGDADAFGATISDNGRYVAFQSNSTTLAPDAFPNFTDIFLRDRGEQSLELISINSSGLQEARSNEQPLVSPDGRLVAFWSSGLCCIGGSDAHRIQVRDRLLGMTEVITRDVFGVPSMGNHRVVAWSADSRFLLFTSDAPDLVVEDVGIYCDHSVLPPQPRSTCLFIWDRSTAIALKVVSAGPNGVGGAGMSADARYVAYYTGGTNSEVNSYLIDRSTGYVEQLNVTSVGQDGNGEDRVVAITPDARVALIDTRGTNLVPGDTNGYFDCVIRDRATETNELVSVTSLGGQGNNHSGCADLSSDGRFVIFNSLASNFADGDQGASHEVFLRDRLVGTTVRVGTATLATSAGESPHAMTSDGGAVAFWSPDDSLVPGDTNNVTDAFVRLLSPSVGGVAEQPDATALPSAAESSGLDYTVYILSSAIALVVALAGWRVRSGHRP